MTWLKLRGAFLVTLAALSFVSALGFTSSSAQAHEWLIEGKTLQEVMTKEKVEEASLSSSLQSNFTFNWPTPINNFEWTCTKESGSGYLWPTTKAQAAFSSMKFEWTGCHFTERFSFCPIYSVVAKVKGQLIENEATKTMYEKFTSPEGEGGVAMTWSWGQTPECSPGGAITFKGSFSAQREPAKIELLSQPLAFSPAIDKAVGSSLVSGSTTLTMSGALKSTLTEEVKGLKWGAY